MPPNTAPARPDLPQSLVDYDLKIILLQALCWLILLCVSIFLIITLFRPQWQQISGLIHHEPEPAVTVDTDSSPPTAPVTDQPSASESLIYDVIQAILDATTEAQLASSATGLSNLLESNPQP